MWSWNCCPPLCCEPSDPRSADTMAIPLKALGDPHGLRLFSLISSSGEAMRMRPHEPLGVSQPTVSHHLRSPPRCWPSSTASSAGSGPTSHVREDTPRRPQRDSSIPRLSVPDRPSTTVTSAPPRGDSHSAPPPGAFGSPHDYVQTQPGRTSPERHAAATSRSSNPGPSSARRSWHNRPGLDT